MSDPLDIPKSTALAKTLSHRNFDPSKYAKSVSSQSDGDKDLREKKRSVQSLGDETSQILKKQVYKYYQQFIETAKEISYLEGEMFQLNHILTEQKNLMEFMTQIFSDKHSNEMIGDADKNKGNAGNKHDEHQKVMKALIEKVEGCDGIGDVLTRYLVHDGDLFELNNDTFTQMRRVHLFLFNDSMMVTTWSGPKRGNAATGKYKFEVLYDLDNLAVINARDGQVKNAFKILMFPDAKMFQCESSKEKRQWLDIMESTKKQYAEDKLNPPTDTLPVSSPPISPSHDSFNPFAKSPSKPFGGNKKSDQKNPLDEQWVQEMPEDLDVYIAQRNFEKAVELIIHTKNFLCQISLSNQKQDVETSLLERTSQLVSVLTKELQSTPDRSHRGGPRAARRPVLLLINLGESTKACQLFLKNRSTAVAYAIRQLRTEGSLPLYVGKLCKVFFSSMKETAKEFESAFKEYSGCYSTFVVWCQKEVEGFVLMISQQVFDSKADFVDLADCVQTVQNHCKGMESLGLELNFTVHTLLLPRLQAAISEHRQKIIDATKLRSSEELWKPTNLGTPQALEKLQDDLSNIGITNIAQFSYDQCFCYLTNSTLAFTKTMIAFVDSVLKMYLPELQKLILDGVEENERCITDFIAGCLKCEQERPQKARLIKRNAMFIAETLMPLIENKLQKKVSQIPKQLMMLRREFMKKTAN